MPRGGMIAALVAGLALAACGGGPEGLVDQVDEGMAVVVAPDGEAVVVPLEGAREGDWLVAGRPSPRAARRRAEAVARLRAQVGIGDRGGAIHLN